MKIIRFTLLLSLFLSFSCKQEASLPKVGDNFYETQLFKDIQLNAVFKDSKTLVDLVPKLSYEELVVLYEEEKNKAGFDLNTFVEANFSDKSMATLSFATDTTKTMYEHISSIWSKLTRGPDAVIPYSSRISLPHKYVVPGGRFQEIYYWDSYFTLEGLLVDNQEELARNMVDNFSFLIDSVGFIPNGTRDYFLTRSQPPFYAPMVAALARKDEKVLLNYLPQMVKEYEFWMAGSDKLNTPFTAERHVVLLEDGLILNRYWDSEKTPRQEAYKEDIHLAADLASAKEKEALYANLRAGAASGWDYSSRWFATDGDFGSTTTTSIVPIDLNCLLHFMETHIAKAYKLDGDAEKEKEYAQKASARNQAMQRYLWNEEIQYFMDYDFKEKTSTDELTMAGAYPLFFNTATEEQAEAIEEKLLVDFLKDGGLVTTLKKTGQQWDAPNGWAPLQWIAVNGLLNYGYEDDAKEIMQRWLSLNERVYKNTGKMMEKYNVEDVSLLSGGGEYETQDGFGWTNGVALGFRHLLNTMEEE
ncbi:alpha,alpha-trehalase TreF [Spongiimicrobium sp. 3-5]|uniref:alpha,alpha-trehalase TreF n=1 Tax=Spongiimicrobium sp. 3-5 TaxID=3332596 RepID=UPI0039811F14